MLWQCPIKVRGSCCSLANATRTACKNAPARGMHRLGTGPSFRPAVRKPRNQPTILNPILVTTHPAPSLFPGTYPAAGSPLLKHFPGWGAALARLAPHLGAPAWQAQGLPLSRLSLAGSLQELEERVKANAGPWCNGTGEGLGAVPELS